MTKKRKLIREAEAKNQPFTNLPFDLTSLIMSYLLKKDNIVASTVCKTWHQACVSVRVEDPIPWLLILPPYYYSETYELCDLSLAKTYTHKVSSVLCYSCILHSTDGWLLIRYSRQNYFFNPFTQDIIQMPCSEYIVATPNIAFSCAPTSKSCVIFAIFNLSESHFTIKTCRVSTKVCTSFIVPKKLPSNYSGFKQIVFSNGIFYCLANNKGSLGMFDLSKNTWNVLPRPRRGLRSSKSFLSEYQGNLFLIYVYESNHRPTIYLELDLMKQEWRENKEISLSGFSFHLSFKSSLMRQVMSSTQGKEQVDLHNVWIKPPVKHSHLMEY